MLIKIPEKAISGRIGKMFMLENGMLWRVGLARFTGSTGMGSIIPFMALFLYSVEGLSPYAIGVIFSATYLAGMVIQPAGGHISDKYGEKKTLSAGICASFLLYLSMWVFASLGMQASFIVMAYIMTSIASSLSYSPYYSLITKSSSKEDMKRTFGIFRVIFNLGFIIGPIAGSFISMVNFSDIFLFASFFRFLELIIILFAVGSPVKTMQDMIQGNKTTKASENRVSGINRKLLYFSLSVMFLAMIGSQIQVSLPLFAFSRGGITIPEYGYIYAMNGLVVVVGQFLINRIFADIDDIASMFMGTLFYMAAFIIAGFSSTFLSIAVLMVLFSIGEDIIAPLENAIVGSFAPFGKIGLYISIKSSFWSAGSVLGPAVGSVVVFLLPGGPFVSWGALDMFGTASMIMLILFRRQVRRDLKESAVPS